ncbi:probable glycosyltransferase STELLO2 [Macadamia integrifolia]|uniref:probable glycosyltransferase STELLO2 n=1 Tax=Macadamia integrifolia TaxID=60698 RepID=UPI001C4E9C3F|nr:probable glycosyltransferase STELLO2 [Macadamia integrifolia]
MLVQDRSSPKPSKPQVRAHPSLPPDRFSEPKNLDFSTWVSQNFCKILAFLVLVGTVAALFFLNNAGNSAALLQSRARELEKIPFPRINWNNIEAIKDKSTPHASFRSERWIVVSVSNYPTDSLRNLVKIRGWQVLAIGTSKTLSDWNLKGAIFLSLEQQANLGFRVVDHVPYDSYVRKTVGYLFAIQHGAKKIFDADDRGEVIDGDLGKHFDLELIGEEARQEPILQYSHDNPNRTVVNPYTHFGQRSVWPRGLPLENVGELAHEEFYTEVYGGKQFIQQGISNGLPDVDSVFYFTRKSGLEALDIRFDEHAPKVALPQGMMVPMNSFNTIFHSPAFWALMLPVSVSTMASDVLRGYWAQRLLWEIGGYAVVYPPTVHRYDKIEAYPFSEEKDLHVNVGRLIKFLVSWRSSKHRLFEKILQLSYAMAEEGFWTELDVKFTAAWLQDLLAVGYQQPRLMSLELDRPRPTIGHGDRKEFIPRKLPSVHLGVEEVGTVNYEIGNLIRWRKNFGNVVLIMFCSGPVERTALEWRLLYGRIFKTLVILSEQSNADLAVEQSQLGQAYKYLPKIFNRFTSAEGFLFLQDDTILNYWNLEQADKTKLWITEKVPESWLTVSTVGNDSAWFAAQADMVKKVVSMMPAHFQVSYKESSMAKHSLILCSSEVFYVPRRFVGDFVELVGLVGNLEIHHNVAVPMFFMAMDSLHNFDSVLSTMIYKTDKPSNNSSSFYSVQVPAVHPWNVSNEPDFIKLIRIMATGDPLLMELV